MALAVAVLLAVGAIVFTLFVRVKDLPELAPVSPAAHLEERKAQIYENLRDLQFEFRLGKLSDSDYQKTKVDLQRELARVLGEIDSMKPAIAAAQAKAAKAPAAATTTAVKRESNVCPHCGAKFPLALKFCGECGKALAS
jgi:hypothetical protein